MHHFCTLFDSNYMFKGLAMLSSLKKNCDDAFIFVLCMDLETRELLEKLKFSYIQCISLDEIETNDLLKIKSDCSLAEYCWTLSPCLPWFLLEKYSEINYITYLDADLYFYSSLKPLFEEISDSSITIIEHRFPDQFKYMEIRGRFCVEWVGFRRDAEGLACLKRWRDQCIEWCFYRLELYRMGDQKYLDTWPRDFKSVHIIQNIGAGVAPWNFSQYHFEIKEDKIITVNEFQLIFYHFHQFQILNNGRFDRLSATYKVLGSEPEEVYKTYEIAITKAMNDVRAVAPGFQAGIKSATRIGAQRIAQILLPRIIKEWLKKFVSAL